MSEKFNLTNKQKTFQYPFNLLAWCIFAIFIMFNMLCGHFFPYSMYAAHGGTYNLTTHIVTMASPSNISHQKIIAQIYAIRDMANHYVFPILFLTFAYLGTKILYTKTSSRILLAIIHTLIAIFIFSIILFITGGFGAFPPLEL